MLGQLGRNWSLARGETRSLAAETALALQATAMSLVPCCKLQSVPATNEAATTNTTCSSTTRPKAHATASTIFVLLKSKFELESAVGSSWSALIIKV